MNNFDKLKEHIQTNSLADLCGEVVYRIAFNIYLYLPENFTSSVSTLCEFHTENNVWKTAYKSM